MRSKRRIIPKVLLPLGFLVLFLTVKYQQTLKDFWVFAVESAEIHFNNLFYQADSETERHRPVSLIETETELKLYIGEPFRNFNQRDWDEFWRLIYAGFLRGAPPREGLPNKMRQLTLDEIASELMKRYPEPFTYFKDEHWKMFFGTVLKK
ncbi:MAG: hypothetical protein AABY28_03250 [Candidatus Omnitrophota bacterium]